VSDEGVPAIRIVCEGDTDEPIITELLMRLVDADFVADWIQPERPLDRPGRYGELGSGWEGVRRWCQRQCERFGSLSAALKEPPLRGCLAAIIHVDADVAGEEGVCCRRPCPPPSGTVDALRAVVLEWAGEVALPGRVVLCIPSQAIEAWVFSALYSTPRLTGEQLECRAKPQTLLKQRPEKLVSGRDNRRIVEAYRAVAQRVAAAWPKVCATCTQAERFDRELRAVL